MARLILHVGAHKTATSYIQRSFAQNRRRLADHGLIYPAISDYPAHHILAAPWMKVAGVPPWRLGLGGADGVWRRFVDEHAGRSGTVFVSAEVFTRLEPDRVDMADLARRLAPFQDVRVVYVARGQVELVQSIWLQAQKTGAARSFASVVQAARKLRPISGVPTDHNQVLDLLARGFDPSRLTVLDYGAINRARGGVLGAMLGLAGVAGLSAEDLEPVDASHANISPNGLAGHIAQQLSRPAAPSPGLVRRLSELIAPEFSATGCAYSGAELKAVETAFAEPNRRFADRVRAYQPDFAFPAIAPRPNWVPRDRLPPALWHRLVNAAAASL